MESRHSTVGRCMTGYLASSYGLRPVPIYLGIGYAVLGALLSILLVRDTRGHVQLEAAAALQQSTPMSFREIFVLTSFGDRFFADLEQANEADFYRRVGRLGRLFIEIETEAFALPA